MAQRAGRLVRQGELPLSYSSVDLYRRCPRRWKFQKVDGMPSDSGLPAELGREIHDWIAQRLAGKDKRFPALPMGAGLSYRQLVEVAEAMLEEISSEVLFGGQLYIERPIAWEYLLPGTKVLNLTIPDVLVVNGQRAVIWDWKSGWRMQAPREGAGDVDEDQTPSDRGSDQGLYYALGAAEHHGVTEVEFRVVMLRWARTLPASYRAPDIDGFREELIALAREISEDTEFRPRPGGECRLCPYSLGKCEVGTQYASGMVKLGPQGVELPPVVLATPEEAERIGAFLCFADEGVTKKLKAWLNDYTDQHGMVRVGKGGWGHWPRYERQVAGLPEFIGKLAGPRAEGAAEALIQALVDEGVDYHSILRPDIKALEGYIWGRKRIPGLDQHVVKTPDEYFGFRKNVEEGPAQQ